MLEWLKGRPRALVWDGSLRRDLVFVITSVVTAVVAPGAALKVATSAVLLVAFVAFLLVTRGPQPTHQAALVVCAACSLASILLSHNGIGPAPFLLCVIYTRVAFKGQAGRVLTGILAVGFAVVIAWISRSPVGLLAGIGVPVLATRKVEQDQLKIERDRAVRLLGELELARDAEAQAAALRERGRIARDMHDVLAHSLAGLSLQLQAVRALAAREKVGPEVTEPLDRAAELARIGVEEAKAAVGALRDGPGSQVLLGLAQLPALIDRFPGRAVLGVTGEPLPLDPAAEHAIYRAVQESLTNATRYAPDSPVRVELDWQAARLRVVITDEGPGTQQVETGMGSGTGLQGMKERLAAVGGEVRSGPLPPGWRTEVLLPFDAEIAAAP